MIEKLIESTELHSGLKCFVRKGMNPKSLEALKILDSTMRKSGGTEQRLWQQIYSPLPWPLGDWPVYE